MPKLKDRLPKYRLHRASGQAIVTLNGQDHYLGSHGTKDSHAAYDRVIAEWLSAGRQRLNARNHRPEGITISQLFVAYWSHVDTYYRKDGEPTGEVQAMKYSLRPVVNLYGKTLVSEFGPMELKAVRETMIGSKLVRRLINHRINRIRRMFRWGVENAMVSSQVLYGLQAVSPLKAGRTFAPESKPVRPVPTDVLEKTREKMPPVLAAMLDLQRLTGMRPNELVIMRLMDIDRCDTVWRYLPYSHKTQHHGKTRMIPLGPKCQAILLPYINESRPEVFLFSPKKRMQEWNAKRREERKSPMTPSQANRRPKLQPRRAPSDHYTPSSYAHAIAWACEQAGVERWGPNRLRHNAATHLRRKYGLDVARVILGHSSPVITEVYAEIDIAKAIEVADQAM